MIEEWLPEDILALIITGVNAKLKYSVTPGLTLPVAQTGTIGSDTSPWWRQFSTVGLLYYKPP